MELSNYDRLVLSPGIDFVDGAVDGWDLNAQNKMPHAYKAGSQTELLKAQLASMPSKVAYLQWLLHQTLTDALLGHMNAFQ